MLMARVLVWPLHQQDDTEFQTNAKITLFALLIKYIYIFHIEPPKGATTNSSEIFNNVDIFVF